MNHIITNSLIMAALIIVVIIPIYILSRSHSKKRLQRLTQRFNALADEHQLLIYEKESFTSIMIGYDLTKRTVLFVKLVQENEESKVVQLENIAQCNVVDDNTNGGTTEIKLVLKDLKETIELSFYKQFIDNEMKMKLLKSKAEFWNQHINKLLKNS